MPQDIVEADEYTTPITIPEPGEERKVLSLKPAFQGLTNRTKHLETRRGDAERIMPGVELNYTNASRALERRPRHDFLPLTDFAMRDQQFYMPDQGYLVCAHAAGVASPQIDLSMQLRLPRGSRLDSVSTCIQGGVGVTWNLKVRAVTFNPFDASTLGPETADALTYGTFTPAPLNAWALNQEIDSDTMRVQIWLHASKPDAAALNIMGYVHCVHIAWLEAGPRGGN